MDRAMRQDAPIYHSDSPKTERKNSSAGGAGHKVYTQLMNGVSHMLPFVVGGGILIALAFLIDGLSVDMNTLSQEARANFGSITPVAAQLREIGNVAFGFMLPVLAGFIAMSIGGPSRSGCGICRRNDCCQREIRISGRPGSRIYCRLSYCSSEKGF